MFYELLIAYYIINSGYVIMRIMKKSTQKTINQTFSIPMEISLELQIFVKSRERSRFVANAIRKELESKKKSLKNAYLSANEDIGQIEATDDWQNALGDSVDEW